MFLRIINFLEPFLIVKYLDIHKYLMVPQEGQFEEPLSVLGMYSVCISVFTFRVK